MVLEKTLGSPLDFEEIQPVHPKGDQSWVFIGRTDVEAKPPILWPPDVKSWLIEKDSDAGKDWGQEETGMTEDKMVGWHHWLNGHGFGWTPGVGDGQGGLACCGSWGHKESDTSEWLNWAELKPLQMGTVTVCCWQACRPQINWTWWWRCWLLLISPPTHCKNIHELSMPSFTKTYHYLPQVGTHDFEGMRPLCLPLPGKAVKLFILSYFTQNVVSMICFITGIQSFQHHNAFWNPGDRFCNFSHWEEELRWERNPGATSDSVEWNNAR